MAGILNQRVQSILNQCIRNVYIYNDESEINEKLIHLEASYLRLSLENKNIKKSDIDAAVKSFCKHFGYSAPKN